MYADSFKNILGKCRKTCAFTLYKMYFKFIYITVLIKYIYIIGIKIKIITSEIIVPEVFVSIFYFGVKYRVLQYVPNENVTFTSLFKT